jgi:hypothetical protein
MRKYNNINIIEISRVMCLPQWNPSWCFVYKLDQQSICEPSSLLIPASVLKWFQPNTNTANIKIASFKDIFVAYLFAKCSFRFPDWFWQPALEGFASIKLLRVGHFQLVSHMSAHIRIRTGEHTKSKQVCSHLFIFLTHAQKGL